MRWMLCTGQKSEVMRWPSSHPLLLRLRLEQVLVIHAAPGIYRQHEPDTSSAARVIQISAISCSHHVARFSA